MLNDKQKGWIYVIFQFLFAALIIYFSLRESEAFFPLNNIVNFIGVLVIASGLLLLLFIIFNFKQMITPNPVPLNNYSLRTTGFYRYIRHPMYSGVLYTLLGVIILYRSASGLIFWILLLVLFILKIRFEEKKLKEKFETYGKYSNKTKKLIPFIY